MNQRENVVQSSEKFKVATCVPLKNLLTKHQYQLRFQHMSKKMSLNTTKKR